MPSINSLPTQARLLDYYISSSLRFDAIAAQAKGDDYEAKIICARKISAKFKEKARRLVTAGS